MSVAAQAENSFGEWTCLAPSNEALFDYVISENNVRVNNVSIQESTAFMTGAPTLNFSASVANRQPKTIAVTMEIVGMRGGQPVFALSGDAGMGFVAAGKNDEVNGTIVTERGSVGDADKLCIRVSAFAAAR